ncbi:MAG: FeoA domain-containing protein [Candidatus Bipolaricaulia bacterium]
MALRGISEGVGLKVVSTRGSVTVNIDGNIVTIGQGMAKKVKVRRT